MYGETPELSIYPPLIIELHTFRKGEEAASESKEKVEDEAEGGIPIRKPFPLQPLNPFHETNRPSNVKWLSTVHNLSRRAPLVDS
jgi:hypothetical protein